MIASGRWRRDAGQEHERRNGSEIMPEENTEALSRNPLDRLKERLVQEEEHLKRATGKMPRFSESGPISMGLFKALVAVVEEQAEEIKKLKEKFANAGWFEV